MICSDKMQSRAIGLLPNFNAFTVEGGIALWLCLRAG